MSKAFDVVKKVINKGMYYSTFGKMGGKKQHAPEPNPIYMPDKEEQEKIARKETARRRSKGKGRSSTVLTDGSQDALGG